MKKLLKSMSLCMTLLLIFQLLIPFSVLAEGTLTPSLSMNSDGNYTVSSVEDLNTMRSDIDKGINYAGKVIVLTQDIDLSQSAALNSFTTQNTFSGCFDGRFHTISGYTDAKSGLFSLVDSSGDVRNLRMEANVVISDASALITDVYFNSAVGKTPYGLIANECAGPISRCSTTGTVTTNVVCGVGGLAGYNRLYTQVDGVTLNGKMTDCFSNVVFNNQVDLSGTSCPSLCGIVYNAGDSLAHCYFYGQFTGNTLVVGYTLPIRGSGCSAATCAYDADVLGFSNTTKTKGVKHTTSEMKTQASYTALGFDFDKCWSIDPAINSGYPYLDPLKVDNAANQAAADVVTAQIAALPAAITLADQSSVQAARAAYTALSEAQKALVTNLAILTAAEATLAQLQGGGADQAAADAVIAQIAALPAAITLADQSSVQAARAAYTALSEAQKALVTNLAILTAAEATLAQLQPGDTTPPVITVKNSADQTLSEDLTVTEPSFSFKVIAQDEKDGTISPSVQLNGTALTAGSDGTYTCTLTTGSNTISITATDAAGNKAEKSLKVTLGTSGTLTPSLSKNSDGNYTVSSAADLNTLRSDIDKGIDYYGKIIVLTQDIDLSQSAALNSFTTQNAFNGCFDGNSHTISGYTDAKSGLFSLIDYSGYVKNLNLAANVVISDAGAIIKDVGGEQYYGLIANESAGTISRCSTTGTVTNNVVCNLAGIVGYGQLTKKVDGVYPTTQGKIANCFSNVVFNNQAAAGSKPGLCGISYWPGDIIEHCYFYGQFTGNTLDNSRKQPIKYNGGDASTCAYDYSVLGFSQSGTSNGVKYTTAQMKTQASYTALGFDFSKCWSIDPAINNGYPYLDPLKEDKSALVKVQVDIQVTVADKTYDASLSEADNLKAVVTNVQIANPTPEIAAAIAKYNVKVDYAVKSATLSSRMGEWPVTVVFDKLELTYDSNDAYEFAINRVLPTTAKYLENGQSGPTGAEQANQVQLAKRAQVILYNTLKSGQGDVPAFTWGGDKATDPGQEGTIQFIHDSWDIFSPARSGYTGVRSGYYDDWFQSVQTGLQAMKDAGIGDQDVKMTEWEKLVLAITAIGYDPRDIKAYDLINIISNKAYQAASHQAMSRPYAVFALNSYNYPTPTDGNRFDIDAYIHGLAAYEIANQPTDPNVTVNARTYDLTLMEIQPLFAYYNPNAKEGDPYYDVKVAVEYDLGIYSKAQTDLGYFYSGNYPDINPWNNAQVYMTLGMAKVNPFDARYIKNGYSMFDGAVSYYNFEKGTCPYNNTSTYEPGQMGRGLDSLVRAYEGRNNIFDCTDVVDSTVPVNKAIAALPETITSANKADVEAAQALYDALSDAKKASLQDAAKAKLVAAQLALGGESDQAAADAVIAQIAALPAAITLADQSSVQAARAAYTALSEAQKALVTNLAILTAAEATITQLQGGSGGDKTPPIIIVKNLADQSLNEDLTVVESGFSFKVTAQDEKDGILSPSVQLNGTLLAAGSNGTYTCTLSLGSNTITITATDAAGNKTEKNLKVTLSQATLLTPPVLSADSTDNTLGKAVDLIFTDDPAWRSAISSITVDGTLLSAGQYTITAGDLQLLAGALTTAGSHAIAVKATGYNDATVNQNLGPATTGLGTVKVSVVDNVQRLASEKASLGANYKEPFGEILPPTDVAITDGLSIRGALEKALATKNMKVYGASNYVSGIGPVTSADGTRTVARLSEFDGGTQSGWMVTLNDWFIDAGANSIVAKDGDVVEFCYTCNQGADVGGDFNNTDTSLKTLSISAGTLSPVFASKTKNYTLTLPAATNIIVTPTAANRTNKVIIQSGGTTYRRTDKISVVDKQVITVTCAENIYKLTIALPQTNQDQARADEVSALITALPTVDQITLADQAKIQAARAAYTALSETQKALVTNLAKLTAAEAKLTQLQTDDAANQAAANVVIAQIGALPATITLSDQRSVEAARAAYTALSEAQKALVTNLVKLTAAEATIAQLQAGEDTTPPIITVKDLTDQPLNEDLTVVESSFSFKVTAQDEKDGILSPSVQLNGTLLAAGSDGSYTCTLSLGSNIITITATDTAGNKTEKSLKVELVNSAILASDIAAGIKSVSAPAVEATTLTMPSVPSGFTIALKSSSNTGVIALDGTITPPEKASKVTLVFTVTKTADGSKADTKKISVTVPKEILVSDIATGIKSIKAPAAGATSLTMPSVPSGFTIAIKSSGNTGVIALDGTITPPEKASKVTLVFTVTKTADGSKADTKKISVTVPKEILVSDITTGIKSIKAPAAGATSLTMPSVPSGFTIAIKSSGNTGVIALDGTITPPEKASKVTLVFTVTKTADGSKADTKKISVTVPKKRT